MDFYYVTYREQMFVDGEWKRTWNNKQKIFVVSDSLENAKAKIEKLLEQLEGDERRAFPNHEVRKCDGIRFIYGFEDSLHVSAMELE